jgi:hypothetical protein
MGISVRQHIASFVAVFLALLIGVLAGVAMTTRPELAKEIALLTETVDRRDQQERDHDELARDFAKRAVPVLVQDKLAGERVAVFEPATSDIRRAERELVYLLERAGAVVVTRTSFHPQYIDRCEEDRERLVADFRLAVGPADGVAEAMTRKIAQVMTQGDGTTFRTVTRTGLVRVDEEAEGRPTMAIVIGGSTTPEPERPERLDLPLIRYLASSRSIKRVVGCETYDVRESVMGAYQRERIPTVDNVDTPAGQFSVVLVLAGADGNFGIKPSAGPQFPEIPEQP